MGQYTEDIKKLDFQLGYESDNGMATWFSTWSRLRW